MPFSTPTFRGLLRRKFGERTSGSDLLPEFLIRTPANFITLPASTDIAKTNIRYPLLEPMVYAHIRWLPAARQLIYEVEEPLLDDGERALLKKLEEAIENLLDVKLSSVRHRKEAVSYLEQKTRQVLHDARIQITPDQYLRVFYYLYRDFIGLNEIEALMHDPYIEDIGCPGTKDSVYVVHRRFGSIQTNIRFVNAEELGNFVIKLAERTGRYISYASPLLDGALRDGSRVQATLAKDITTKGPTFSIRKFRKNPFSPVDMIKLGTASPTLLAYLWTLIEAGSSLLVCGATSTGKTTFLNVLSMFIPMERKIISLEDTRELSLPHENWIPAVARPGFGPPESTGKRYGEVDLFDLLKESFRQNPDYVIVGEVRGAEAYVLFQGMSSGHASLGTIHAASAEDVVKRLETPPISLSPTLLEALDALVVMVNAGEKGKSSRRIQEVAEIEGVDAQTGHVKTTKPFFWLPNVDEFREEVDTSTVLRKVAFRKGKTMHDVLAELHHKRRMLEWLVEHNVVYYKDVASMINMYYKDPERVMAWVAANHHPDTLFASMEEMKRSATGLRFLKAD